jgi:hypothetical protein
MHSFREFWKKKTLEKENKNAQSLREFREIFFFKIFGAIFLVYLNTLLLTTILLALLNSMQRKHFKKLKCSFLSKTKIFSVWKYLAYFYFFSFFSPHNTHWVSQIFLKIYYYYYCHINLSKFTTKKRKSKKIHFMEYWKCKYNNR